MAKSTKSTTFSQRHYERIAEVLRRTRPARLTKSEELTATQNEQIVNESAWIAWENVVVVLADDFAKDNSRFNRTKFYVACGIEG